MNLISTHTLPFNILIQYRKIYSPPGEKKYEYKFNIQQIEYICYTSWVRSWKNAFLTHSYSWCFIWTVMNTVTNFDNFITCSVIDLLDTCCWWKPWVVQSRVIGLGMKEIYSSLCQTLNDIFQEYYLNVSFL